MMKGNEFQQHASRWVMNVGATARSGFQQVHAPVMPLGLKGMVASSCTHHGFDDCKCNNRVYLRSTLKIRLAFVYTAARYDA